MHKSARNITIGISSGLMSLLLLLVGASIALAQQPATSPTPANETNPRASERLVDASIPDDQAVDKMLAAYSPKVRALDNVIGTVKGELRRGGMGSGALGNFVVDGLRVEAAQKLGRHIDLAIMNGGGLRRGSIGDGEVRAREIFELLPFENALVTMELTGEQLVQLLGAVTASRDSQSGARLTYRTTADRKSELETAKLLDEQNREKDIDPKATYTVVTIDYLVNVGRAAYAVLREGKNTRQPGITLRDAIIDYVKSETAAGRAIKPIVDDRFVLDQANSVPAPTGARPPE
jgi:2',3'-cyclic-nucleotide 2'-phosphodiesterase (5'-nucleotidase family)